VSAKLTLPRSTSVILGLSVPSTPKLSIWRLKLLLLRCETLLLPLPAHSSSLVPIYLYLRSFYILYCLTTTPLLSIFVFCKDSDPCSRCETFASHFSPFTFTLASFARLSLDSNLNHSVHSLEALGNSQNKGGPLRLTINYFTSNNSH
jgi:hypothetical protein